MKIKNVLFAVTIMLLLSACVAPTIVSVEQKIVDEKFTKVYTVPLEKVVSIVEESVDALGWVKLEEHRNVLSKDENGKMKWEIDTKKAFYVKSDYKYSWNVVAPKTTIDDLIFLKVRTIRSLKSFGADIYLGISSKNKTTTVKYSGSTQQVEEKEKLKSYLEQLSSKVNEKILLLENKDTTK